MDILDRLNFCNNLGVNSSSRCRIARLSGWAGSWCEEELEGELEEALEGLGELTKLCGTVALLRADAVAVAPDGCCALTGRKTFLRTAA